MSDEQPEPDAGKTRRRSSVKPVNRQPAKKVKCTIHLSVEASQRLDIHATMMGFDRSALVEKLISESLRRYVVSDRGGHEQTAGEEAA